jgi:hypothetical protein
MRFNIVTVVVVLLASEQPQHVLGQLGAVNAVHVPLFAEGSSSMHVGQVSRSASRAGLEADMHQVCFLPEFSV